VRLSALLSDERSSDVKEARGGVQISPLERLSGSDTRPGAEGSLSLRRSDAPSTRLSAIQPAQS